jgi:hypothetical protein
VRLVGCVARIGDEQYVHVLVLQMIWVNCLLLGLSIVFSSILKLETEVPCETSANVYQTVRRHITATALHRGMWGLNALSSTLQGILSQAVGVPPR